MSEYASSSVLACVIFDPGSAPTDCNYASVKVQLAQFYGFHKNLSRENLWPTL